MSLGNGICKDMYDGIYLKLVFQQLSTEDKWNTDHLHSPLVVSKPEMIGGTQDLLYTGEPDIFQKLIYVSCKFEWWNFTVFLSVKVLLK